MIGVSVSPERLVLAQELFELFKIPWEPCKPTERYEAVIAFSVSPPMPGSRLTVMYEQVDPEGVCSNPVIQTDDTLTTTVHFGFDLLQLMERLFSDGEKHENARTPVLDQQISVLRSLLVNNGVSFVEITPVPQNHGLIACLTHDVDFVGIRRHFLDKTFFGFLLRSTVGSARLWLTGRLVFRDLFSNLLAVLSLPLVYLRVLPDFMNCFRRYTEVDGPGASTYYVVPFRRNGGRQTDARTSRQRAVKYDVDDIPAELVRLRNLGAEIAVHGIDAWHSSDNAAAELRRVYRNDTAVDTRAGIRIHWLWYNSGAPSVLDRAGYDYDSTFGYNDGVGFRSGTAQVYQPPGCKRLLELPLMIQDTALFYPSRMNLSQADAWPIVTTIVDHVVCYGGVLVVNWHQRSLGPDRQWGRFYRRLVDLLRERDAWLATASNAVAWFRRRRKLRLDVVASAAGTEFVVRGEWPGQLPLPVIRSYGDASVTLPWGKS